jgi:hypothetical protein
MLRSREGVSADGNDGIVFIPHVGTKRDTKVGFAKV